MASDWTDTVKNPPYRAGVIWYCEDPDKDRHVVPLIIEWAKRSNTLRYFGTHGRHGLVEDLTGLWCWADVPGVPHE